jgi:hypothetical protein
MWNNNNNEVAPPVAQRDWVEFLNLIAVLLHGGQAIAVAVLYERLGESTMFDGGRLPLFRTAWNATRYSERRNHTANATLISSSTGDDSLMYTLVSYGTLDVRACILLFFVLSALFQGAASWLSAGRSGIWRYVEYSLSASVMALAIAAEAGIRDLYALVGVCGLIWVTMGLGIVADWTSLLMGGTWAWVAPHLASWATCLTAYGCILDSFNFNASRGSPPDFVRIIVFVQLGLFTCFGFVQTWALAQRTYAASAAFGGDRLSADETVQMILRNNAEKRQQRSRRSRGDDLDDEDDDTDKDEDGVELAFIVLSLTAKSLLCWIVLSPLLQRD